jgi:hypothetical protein
MERIARLPDTGVVVAVDHGFCEIQELRAVKGLFRDGATRESDALYDPDLRERKDQFGKRYVDLQARRYDANMRVPWLRPITEPARWGLPDSNGYLIAGAGCGFSLDSGPVLMFAHGGVSMEEMIVPVALLASTGSR